MAVPVGTQKEAEQRDRILNAIRAYIREDRIIPMNDPQFAGGAGGYNYFFEGEDDLLHLGVERAEKSPLTVEEVQSVLSFIAPQLAAGVVWVKPGTYSHHFYFAHDELL
jgi:hypothetical protein